jgi:hypothetical protein
MTKKTTRRSRKHGGDSFMSSNPIPVSNTNSETNTIGTAASTIGSAVVTGADNIVSGAQQLGSTAVEKTKEGAQGIGSWFTSLFSSSPTPAPTVTVQSYGGSKKHHKKMSKSTRRKYWGGTTNYGPVGYTAEVFTGLHPGNYNTNYNASGGKKYKKKSKNNKAGKKMSKRK